MPEQISQAQIKHVRETVFYDVCRFVLKDNHSPPSFDRDLAMKFLQRRPFFDWIVLYSRCFEIYNRLYLHDELISRLYGTLRNFLGTTTRTVVEFVYKSVGEKPLIFKGIEIMNRYSDYTMGYTFDLDLRVNPSLLEQTCRALQEQDWIRGHYVKDRGIVPYDAAHIAKAEAGHYETLPFVKMFDLAFSNEERDYLHHYPNSTFFELVDPGETSTRTRFEIDVHWGYLSNFNSDGLQTEDSIFPFATTLQDSDHLYLMLLRNYYEAVKTIGKTRNLLLALLLIENAKIDCDKIYFHAVQDGRQAAIAANVVVLERIAPHLVQAVDPARRFHKHVPNKTQMSWFQNSLLGLHA